MSNVEILGKPLYRSLKSKLQEEQSLFVQKKSEESNKVPTYTDIEYERDESDWWWCEDM